MLLKRVLPKSYLRFGGEGSQKDLLLSKFGNIDNILWCTEVIIYLSWAVDENDVRISSTTSTVSTSTATIRIINTTTTTTTHTISTAEDVKNTSTTSAVLLTATATLTGVATASITATAENVTLSSNGTTIDVFSLLRREKPWDLDLLKKILLILGVVAFYVVLITFMIRRGLIQREKKKELEDPEKQVRGSSVDTQRRRMDRSTSQKVGKADPMPNGSADIETEAKEEQKRTDKEEKLNEGDPEEKSALREASEKMS